MVVSQAEVRSNPGRLQLLYIITAWGKSKRRAVSRLIVPSTHRAYLRAVLVLAEERRGSCSLLVSMIIVTPILIYRMTQGLMLFLDKGVPLAKIGNQPRKDRLCPPWSPYSTVVLVRCP